MKLGDTQQKILLLLMSGIALGCSASPKQSFRIIKIARKEWLQINRTNITRSIRALYKEKLVSEQKHPDGSVSLRITEAGRREATLSQLLGVKIKKPAQWDKLWRIVIFDIPEKHKKFRDIFRSHLKAIGFHEFQHSVLIFPFPCKNEILALIKLYKAEPYVRFITAKDIDNGESLKRKFLL